MNDTPRTDKHDQQHSEVWLTWDMLECEDTPELQEKIKRLERFAYGEEA
jgi:hypothetical protein